MIDLREEWGYREVRMRFGGPVDHGFITCESEEAAQREANRFFGDGKVYHRLVTEWKEWDK